MKEFYIIFMCSVGVVSCIIIWCILLLKTMIYLLAVAGRQLM